MRPRTNQDRERLIHAALRFCSKQMHRHAVLVGGKRSSTTLVGFWAPPDQAGSATAFNIGDSSLFRITQNAIAKLSHDHSLRQIWVDGGRISAEPSKRVITQAMGISPEIHAHITSFAIAARRKLCRLHRRPDRGAVRSRDLEECADGRDGQRWQPRPCWKMP